MRTFLLWALLAPFLSACLGGDIVTPSEARVLERRANNYDSLRADVADLPNTAWAAVPTSGQLRFVGVASLRIGEPTQRTSLVGDADLSIDFDTGTVEGQMDRFFGVDASRDVAEYRGAILINEGAIGIERPNDWRASYSGDLRGNGDDIRLDGTIVGDFVGTPIQGITASETEGDVAFLNDISQPVRLDIAAQP